jgi:hypothetical protein
MSLIETGGFHRNRSMVMSPEINIDAPNITIKEGNKKGKGKYQLSRRKKIKNRGRI